ncbi:cell division protein ZapC, partial [Vibrio sp. V37_P2S8PM304]
YEDREGYLMLDLGEDMIFKTNLERKLLVDCAVGINEFSVDDASAFQTFKEQISLLPLSEPRQAELALYCVAAKRFHKPVQPKSWFFDAQGDECQPSEGDIVKLSNSASSGHFIVLEVGDNASLVAYIDLEEFQMSGSKSLVFGQAIKVMHDRMLLANQLFQTHSYAMVG